MLIISRFTYDTYMIATDPFDRTHITHGNALTDGADTRGWIVGNFIDPSRGLHHSDDVEIKWGVHQKDQARLEWVTSEVRTTICILVSGRFEMDFRDRTLSLDKPGDYIMWGEGVDHRWRVLEDCVTITVRWPSIIEY